MSSPVWTSVYSDGGGLKGQCYCERAVICSQALSLVRVDVTKRTVVTGDHVASIAEHRDASAAAGGDT